MNAGIAAGSGAVGGSSSGGGGADDLREQANVVVRSICDFLVSLLFHSISYDEPPAKPAIATTATATASPSSNAGSADKLRRLLSHCPAECSQLQLMSLHSKLIADVLIRIEQVLMTSPEASDAVISKSPNLLLNLDTFIQFIVYRMQTGLLNFRALQHQHLTALRVFQFTLDVARLTYNFIALGGGGGAISGGGGVGSTQPTTAGSGGPAVSAPGMLGSSGGSGGGMSGVSGSGTAAPVAAKASFFSGTFGSKKLDPVLMGATQALAGLRKSLVALALHVFDDPQQFSELEIEQTLNQLAVHGTTIFSEGGFKRNQIWALSHHLYRLMMSSAPPSSTKAAAAAAAAAAANASSGTAPAPAGGGTTGSSNGELRAAAIAVFKVLLKFKDPHFREILVGPAICYGMDSIGC